MSIMDADLLLRDGSADLNADETTPTALDFGGPDQHEFTYVVVCPTLATGTTPTLDVTIEESDDNSTFHTALTFRQIAAADTPGKFYITAKLDGRYRRYTADIGADNDFKKVIIAAVIGGLYEDF
jgi:hypothetical protein